MAMAMNRIARLVGRLSVAFATLAGLSASLPLAATTITVNTLNGSLTQQGSSSFCTYESMQQDLQGNWVVGCGPGPKTITFSNPALTGSSCSSIGGMSEDTSGNWTVTGCAVACAPSVTLTQPGGALTIPAGVPYTLKATATANCSRSISKVEFLNAGALLPGGAVMAPPYDFSWIPSAGNYEIEATATDSANDTKTTARVAVRANAGPTGVTVTVTPPGPRAFNATFTLSATASDSDGVKRVEYYAEPSTLLGQSTTGPSYTVTWPNVAAGTYQVFARAIDLLDASSESTRVTVVVTATNSLPTVNVTSPTEGQVVTGAVALEATATDADGSIVQVEYVNEDTGQVIWTSTAGPNYPYTWNAPIGTHRVRARATDNSNGIGLSPLRTFQVNLNNAPMIGYDSLVGSAFSAFAGSPVTLRVNAQDFEGSPITVQFFNVTTGVPIGNGTFIGGNGYTLNWSPGSEGVHQVRATASDGSLSSSVDLWVVALSRPAAAGVIPGSKATSTVGAIAANFAVSEGGAATYSIPIAVPPGPAGAQPSLAIAYSSQGGNGALGVGWGVSGTSSITRCPSTVATNGAKDSINYDNDATNDKYCLDGQRLVVVVPRSPTGQSSNCGGPSSPNYKTEYRTEVESYSRIVAFEEDACFLGPTRFEVFTKGGQWMMFGLASQAPGIYGDADSGTVVMSFGNSQMTPEPSSVFARANQVKTWPLSRTMDAAGNVIRYEYCGTNLYTAGTPAACVSNPTGPVANIVYPFAAYPPTEHHIKTIHYGGHASRTTRIVDANPTARVDFVYATRATTDQVRAFDSGGGETTLTYFLQSVATSTSSQFAQSYVLDYEIGMTSRYRLKSVMQCGGKVSFPGESGACLAPTVFSYSAGASSSFQQAPPITGRDALDINDAGDIDGDGRTDLIYVRDVDDTFAWVALSSNNHQWETRPLRENGVAITVSKGTQRYLADFNGDGKADLVLKNGDNFRFCDLGFPGGSTGTCYTSPVLTSATGSGFYLQGDFDGDGRIDLLVPRGSQSTFRWSLHMGTPTGIGSEGTAILGLHNPFDENRIEEEFAVGDFNGDGRADVIIRKPGAACGGGGGPQAYVAATCGNADIRWIVCLSRPTGPQGQVQFYCNGEVEAGFGLLSKSLTMDFNGDGLADLAYPKYPVVAGRENDWTICLSSGEGSFEKSVPGTSPNTYAKTTLCKDFELFTIPGVGGLSARPREKVVFGDFDGDGRSDFATHNNNGAWRICLARGDDISAAGNANPLTFLCQDWAGGFNPMGDERDKVLVGDFNGDGKTDLLRYQISGSPILVQSAGTVPDLLTFVSNGLGATTQIDYLPITNSTVYTKGTAVAAATEVVVQSPLYVVRATYEDNGIGGTFDHTYGYTGLKGSTDGRGLLGFATRSVTDSNNITRTTTYNQSLAEWWKAGRPTRIQTQSPARVLSDIRTQWGLVLPVLYGNVYPVNLEKTVEAKVDLNGAVLPCTATTTSSMNQYGNPGAVVSETGTCNIDAGTFDASGYSKTTTSNVYYPANASTWMLGRLQSATVTHEATGKASVTRASSFGYNGLNDSCAGAPVGHLCSEIIEPGEPTNGDKRNETRYEYDSRGNVTRTTKSFFDPAANAMKQRVTTASYDPTGRFVARVTNAEGHVEDRTYDARFGAVQTITRFFGDPAFEPTRFLRTTSAIDGFGRKVGESLKGADGLLIAESDVTWASEGLAGTTAVYAVTTLANTGAWAKAFFDKLQREVARETRTFADGITVKSFTTYDARGHKAAYSRPLGPGSATTAFTYDELDRVFTETTNTTPASFTTITTNTYSGLEAAVRRTNSTGTDQKTVSRRDKQGRVELVTDCLGTGAESDTTTCGGQRTAIATSYGYDATGNLASVTTPATPTNPSGLTRITTFDKLGRRSTSNDPDIGFREYFYNGAGETVTERYTPVAGAQVAMTSSYDGLGRLTERWTTRAGTGHVANFIYDDCNYSTKRFNGSLCARLSGDEGIANFEERYLDDYGRTFRATTKLDSGTTIESHAFTLYDAQSRPSQSVHAPSGHGVTHEYKPWGGFKTAMRDVRNPSVTYWSASERFTDGQIKTMTVGGASVTQGYDGFGRANSIVATQAGSNPQNDSYSYDALGNLTSRSNGQGFQSFDYDSLNRVTAGGGAAYDNAGNITSLNGGHTYWPGTNRVQTTALGSYNYDAVGNMTSGAGRTITWKPFNMPASATKAGQSITWSYGPDFERVRENSSATGTTLYFPGGERIAASDGSIRWRHYISSPEGAVGSVDVVTTSGGAIERRYWLRDHLGSVVASIDGATGPTPFSYTVWGDRSSAVTLTASTVQRGYTGHEMLDEVGLVHMNGRIYDPAIGKFLSADPIVQYPMSGQSWNRYSYVMNNPLSATDPTGYSSMWVQWRRPIAAIAVAVITYNVAYAMQTAALYETVMAAELASIKATAAIAAGFASGGVAGGNIQSAIQGAFFAGLNFGVGSFVEGLSLDAAGKAAVHAAMHGVVGCAQQSAAGGSCRAGAASGGFSALAAHVPGLDDAGLPGRIVVGAVASRLAGGAAQNGAVTAAFEYLFNQALHASVDAPPSRGIQYGRIRSEMGLVEKIETRWVPYLEDGLEIKDSRGQTVMAREDHWQGRDGQRYVIRDHQLGHAGSRFTTGPHLNVSRITEFGEEALGKNNGHYFYQPTHPHMNSAFRVGGQVRPSVWTLLERQVNYIRASGWQY